MVIGASTTRAVLRSSRPEIREHTLTHRRPVIWALTGVAAAAWAVFIALTIVVTANRSLELDSQAFKIAGDLRAPWLDNAARVLTTLGLIAIVGPVLLIGAVHLYRLRHHARAAAILTGGAVVWVAVWIVKAAVDRPRPPAPLVHTSGQSFPSGHAANAIGYLALAIVLSVVIRTRAGRIAVVAAGAVLAALVGLSRIYLRAHYASDVLAGEALAIGTYAIAAVTALIWQGGRGPLRSHRPVQPVRNDATSRPDAVKRG